MFVQTLSFFPVNPGQLDNHWATEREGRSGWDRNQRMPLWIRVRVQTDTSGILMYDGGLKSESLFLGLTTQPWPPGRTALVSYKRRREGKKSEKEMSEEVARNKYFQSPRAAFSFTLDAACSGKLPPKPEGCIFRRKLCWWFVLWGNDRGN